MAAPDSKNILDLTGTWTLNRKLSDDPDKIFALQGVPWVVRKVLRYAGLTLQFTQSSSSEGANGSTNGQSDVDPGADVVVIHAKQTISPGSFDSDGSYPIDGKPHDYSLPIFGDVSMQLRYMSTMEVADEAVRQRFLESNSTTVIDEAAHNKEKGWQARVIWGFEMCDGGKYFTRHTVITKDDEAVKARIVYDYKE